MKQILLIAFLTLTTSALFSQEAENTETDNKIRLVTVYDKSCPHCYDLMNKTYKDPAVKTELEKVEHVYLEVSSEKAQRFMKTFSISGVPAQVMTKIVGRTVHKVKVEGNLEVNDQLEFMKKATEKLTGVSNDEFISERYVKMLCSMVYKANLSTEAPYEIFLKSLAKIVKAKNVDIGAMSLPEFAFNNINKLVCENKDLIKVRKHNTILKYALDSKNYKFLRRAIFVKKDGKNICNPAIDFKRIEIIDGQEETLLDFFDKVLNHADSSAFHDLGAVRNIKYKIEACVQSQNNRNKK